MFTLEFYHQEIMSEKKSIQIFPATLLERNLNFWQKKSLVNYGMYVNWDIMDPLKSMIINSTSTSKEKKKFFFQSFCLLGPYPRHMEVPRLGGSNQSCNCWPTPELQHHQIRAVSATYTTAHSNAGSLAHWARRGIKPATSWLQLWDCIVPIMGIRFIPLRHDGNSLFFVV